MRCTAAITKGDHPARQVAQQHMQALRSRMQSTAQRLGEPRPDQLAAQLAVLVNGAFVSADLLGADEATAVLLQALHALLAGAQAAQ